MRELRLFKVALIALLSTLSACCVAASGTDFSDHWWNPQEPGWGLAIQQQSDVLFVQLLVYAADGSAVWYTTSASVQPPGVDGESVYSGDLFLAAGRATSAPSDAAAVTLRKVGTLSFNASTSDTAMLSYTIDGVPVSKSVTRLTWKSDDLTGQYYGGMVYDTSPLHGPCIPGHFEDLGPMTVTQNGTASLVMSVQGSSRACTYTGDFRQIGHMVTTTGKFLCSQGGVSGTYTGLEIEKTAYGLTGRIVGETTLCEFQGNIGGVRR